MSKLPWELMLAGHPDEALRLMRDAYMLRSGMSETMELGIGYLWVKDYGSAWEHFDAVNRKRPKHSDGTYEMAGVAKWCVGERRAAVEQWIVGCDCDYADAAGGAGSPLLLFTASVIAPEVFPRDEAEKLLTVRANDLRVRLWPGPVVEFVLGRIDESGVRQHCVGVQPRGTASRHWLVDIYVGILALAAGNVAAYAERMRKAADSSPPYTRPKQQGNIRVRAFSVVDKLWSAEFFIARDESAKL